MRKLYSSVSLALVLAASAAHAQAPVWAGGAQSINPTPTNDTGAIGLGLSLDAAGNQYVAGALQNGAGSGAPGTRAFGSTSLTGGGGTGSGFVGKLSAAQQWQWALRVTSTGEGPAFTRTAVSPAGDVYTAGYTADLGAGTVLTIGTLAYTTTSAEMGFITRLNASGQPQWVAGAANAFTQCMQWDAVAGNLIVAGYYYGTTAFGTTTLPVAARGGLFVARLNAAGQWLSAVGVAATGTSANLTVTSAAVGALGQVALTGGLTTGAATFGSISLAASTTGTRVYVAQLSPAGVWQWVASSSSTTAATTTGSQGTGGTGVAYTPGGNVWVVGTAAPNTTIGASTVGGATTSFAAQLSGTAGTWGTVAAVTDVTAQNVASDAAGNGVVLATFGTAPLFNGGIYTFGTQSFTAAGRRTAVARLTPTGVWQYAVPTPAIGTGSAVSNNYALQFPVLDAAGNLYATGYFRGGPLALGSTALTASLFNNSTAVGFGGDVLVAKLSNAGVLLAVRQAAGVAPLAVYPNPATASAGATLRLPTAVVVTLPVTLRDALGRVAVRTTMPAGHQELAVPTAGLAPGLYLIEAGLSRTQIVVE